MRCVLAVAFLLLPVILREAQLHVAFPQPSNLSTFKPSNVPVPCELYPFVFFLLRKTCSNDAPPANSTNTTKVLDRITILC